MPFYWRRRNRWWYGRRYQRRNLYKRRKYRPKYRRRWKRRRAPRRRRRRRRKVRRKRKTLNVTQWQPDSIVNCKIKGLTTTCLGSQGRQSYCYTTTRNEWTIPKSPCGGGFGLELYTLDYLYSEWQYRKNIWTKTNKNKDLCRYTGCKFRIFRHPKVDFVIAYDKMPPFDITKYSFMQCHPMLLLLRKRKRILLSKQTNPKGKLAVSLRIKPPKQMINKWFFQEYFSKYGLVSITVAAASLQYANLGCCNENQIVTLYYLNADFFDNSNWIQHHGDNPYMPISTLDKQLLYIRKVNNQDVTFKPTLNSYNSSINYDTGWFNKGVLLAYKVQTTTGQVQAHIPCGVARYNPNEDSGKGNKVWLTNLITGHYNVPSDNDLVMEGYPLYLIFYGYLSYINFKKKDASYMDAYMFIVQSPAIRRLQTTYTRNYYPIIDKKFMEGGMPYNQYIDNNMKQKWYPNVHVQLESINSIVETGPYIPKLGSDRDSTWECNSKYTFYFKWGGPLQTDQPVENPKEKTDYDVPDKILQTVQISNPKRQKFETILKPWDYRRGYVTETALKRMYEHLETDSDVYSDAESPTKKKKRMQPTLFNPEEENQKIQTCLLSLCEESTSQESQEEKNLYQLIKQQQQQQKQLKHNLLTILSDMKQQQKALQYQTGTIP